MNQKACVVCNNCLFANEQLLKVTGSHINSKCGNISKSVHDGDSMQSLTRWY